MAIDSHAEILRLRTAQGPRVAFHQPGGVEPCRGVAIPIGVNADGGLVAATCDRPDFPDEIDQLLSVAANYAATAFQSARLVHERRRAEEALREQEELNTRILESTHDCIKVLNLCGELLYVNTRRGGTPHD